jgi:hypothetical protein
VANVRIPTIAAVALAAAACSANPPPVPVFGDEQDLASLAGEWTGEYWSVESGRTGSILFRLEAGSDSAVGDVLMIPASRYDQHHHHGDEHPQSEFISIRFVRIQAGRVRGQLDMYRDPECGCRLDTSFEGTLRADTLSGTFSSRHLESGHVRHGHWRAVRTIVAGNGTATM